MLLISACAALTPSTGTPTADADTSAQPLTPVRLGVGYIPNVQFAPFYVGIEKGFFADEGLDVSLDYGFENDYLALVGTDDLQFMVGSGDQIILGRAQGLPVRYVLNWYTKYPVVIFAKSEKGITTPADLAGKTVGLPGQMKIGFGEDFFPQVEVVRQLTIEGEAKPFRPLDMMAFKRLGIATVVFPAGRVANMSDRCMSGVFGHQIFGKLWVVQVENLADRAHIFVGVDELIPLCRKGRHPCGQLSPVLDIQKDTRN